MIDKLLFSSSITMMTIITHAQQKPFTIDGNIQGKTGDYIYLNYFDENDKPKTDSSMIENGKFSFAGKLTGPAQAMVMMNRNARFFDKYAQLYITPNKMQLSLDYNNFSDGAVLKGSSVQTQADLLDKMKAPALAKLKPMRELYDKANNIYIEAKRANKDSATLEMLKNDANKAKDALDPFIKEVTDVEKTFMDKYPDSYVTASVMRYHISRMKLEEAEQRYNKLSNEVKSTSLGKEIGKELNNLRMGSPGAKAFVFASKELRGTPLSLTDYKGKYVLLDFWASWCVPCRAGNPHLLSLYAKYKDKGFEIIGISDDDRNLEAWKKAVEKDQIGVWKHVLRGLDMEKRLKGEKDETDINQYYGIHTLPTKILIDPEGVIIGRYGGGGENNDAMDQKLEKIFRK